MKTKLKHHLSRLGVFSFLDSIRRFSETRRWISSGCTGSMKLMPCLHDRFEEGGATKGEYFWQDLMVARWIHAAAPEKHVDVGSRIDGFVAHVASFREIEVFDVRPVTTRIPGVTFTQADLMDANSIAPLIAGGGVLRLTLLPARAGTFRFGSLWRPD